MERIAYLEDKLIEVTAALDAARDQALAEGRRLQHADDVAALRVQAHVRYLSGGEFERCADWLAAQAPTDGSQT